MVSKYCVRAVFSEKRACSAFIVSILHVIEMRSEKQVVWVYASRRVAPVKNMQAVWNRAILKKPRYAVRGLFGAADMEPTMPALAFRRKPKPAIEFGSPHNMFPKSYVG